MATANTRVSLTVDVHTNLRRSPVPSCSPPQQQQRLEQDLGVLRNAAGSCSECKHVPHSPKSDSQQAKDGNKKKRVNRTATAKLKQSKLGVRREQWLAQGAGKQGKADQSECPRDLDLKDILGTGDSSGQEVMQKFVGAESGKACVEDGFSTEDSDNESPVTSSEPCFQSESKAEESKGAFPKVRQKGSERQVWRELYVSESSTMPKTSPSHSKPKVGKAGARRGCLSSSRGEHRTCLDGDNGVNCGEHTDRNRQQQSELDEAAAGLCCLSVSSQSPPVGGRESGCHKAGGDPRGRLPADRSVTRSKTSSRDVDSLPQAVGSGENDPSKRKGSTRKQSTPASVPTLGRSKSLGNEDVAGSTPPMGEGDSRRKGGSRPYVSDDHGVSRGDEEVVTTQSTGAEKKAVATAERSHSAEGASVDEEPAAGGTTELKQTVNDGTAWSSSDGASTSHSGRSSGSSSSSYAGSGSEEDNDEHRDPEDDWETAADALYTHSMYRNNGEGKGKGFKGDSLHHGGKDTLDKKTNGFSSSELQHGGVLKPEYKYKTNGFGRMRGNGGRAWRPDDVSRPPTLPRLTKQHSYPMQSAQGVWGPVHGNMWGPPATPSYCPICTEELDMTDSSFVPCSCGFRLCLFCHHRIASDDGRCPGCRKAYNSDVAMKLSRASSMWLRA